MTDGQTIVVTGAASGIGRALVDQILDNAPGTTVIAIDRAEFTDPRVTALQCDLADQESIARLALPDRIDGLANVAGVPGTAPAATVLAVNTLGLQTLTYRVLDRMSAGSVIVNVASVAAQRNTTVDGQLARLMSVRDADEVAAWLADNPIGGSAAYDTSKRVLVDWTVMLSAALQPRGIRVVSVSPGPIDTPILADFEASMGSDSIARSAAVVGRHGSAAEPAAAVRFLLSASASWINGIDVPVEGGLLAARVAAGSPTFAPVNARVAAGDGRQPATPTAGDRSRDAANTPVEGLLS